jgi:hypothetical protein
VAKLAQEQRAPAQDLGAARLGQRPAAPAVAQALGGPGRAARRRRPRHGRRRGVRAHDGEGHGRERRRQSHAFGGSGGEGGAAPAAPVRRRFADTALWAPTVKTGAGRQGPGDPRAPDDLTTWRVTARGATRETLVGDAEARFRTTKSFVVSLALPRTVTTLDSYLAGIVVDDRAKAAEDTCGSVSLLADGVDAGTGPVRAREAQPGPGRPEGPRGRARARASSRRPASPRTGGGTRSSGRSRSSPSARPSSRAPRASSRPGPWRASTCPRTSSRARPSS